MSVEFLEKGEPLELSRNSMLYQLDKNDLQNVKADNSYDVTDDKPVEISWKALEKASSYKVQISGKEDFSDILEEKIVKNNSLKLTNIKIGQTHFRVVPENEQGVSIAKAAKGKVMTYFPPPEESSLKTQDKGDHQILKWGKVPYAKAYKVTYKTDPESDIEKTKIVTGTNFKLTDNTGFVQWKVRVVDPESNRAMSSNSNTVDWYDSAKRLASVHGSGMAGTDFPKITKPEPRKTFISVNSSPLFIVINWQFDKGASEYEVEVSQKADMSGTVFKRRVKGKKRAVINQKFEPGIYYMRVRAMQENVTHERWSETEVFRVMDRKAQ